MENMDGLRVIACGQIPNPANGASVNNRVKGCSAQRIGVGDWRFQLDLRRGDSDLGNYAVIVTPYGGGEAGFMSWSGGGNDGIFNINTLSAAQAMANIAFSFVVVQVLQGNEL